MGKQAGFHQATLLLCGTMHHLLIGLLDLWIILELSMGLYHPLEPKGDQVVHIMFQMMHGSMWQMVVGSLQMPMMSA